MAHLTSIEKGILEKLLQMGGGYVLDFSDRTMGEFFRDDLGIDIYDMKYAYGSGSKANRMRGFWLVSDNMTVARSIAKLTEYIESHLMMGSFRNEDYPKALIESARDIARGLVSGKDDVIIENKSKATFKNGSINIELQKEIFDHVQKLLNDGHFFNAVEEAYKIVRKKLKEVSGSEKATDAFANQNLEKIFGHQPIDDVEKDFFEGVKFLHMAIQFLRNEKAHTPALEINKNLAIHYISLASLAYDLIAKKNYI